MIVLHSSELMNCEGVLFHGSGCDTWRSVGGFGPLKHTDSYQNDARIGQWGLVDMGSGVTPAATIGGVASMSCHNLRHQILIKQ